MIFTYSQKQSEVQGLKTMLKTKEESSQFETNELRSKCDSLRTEVVNLSGKIDKLSEEKNQYRSQVQEMNIALKNSLEHIKRLRCTQSTTSDEFDVDSDLVSLKSDQVMEEIKKPNLVNLQNCLASLKYEMAILQKKLAPSTTNSPERTLAGVRQKETKIDDTEHSLVIEKQF